MSYIFYSHLLAMSRILFITIMLLAYITNTICFKSVDGSNLQAYFFLLYDHYVNFFEGQHTTIVTIFQILFSCYFVFNSFEFCLINVFLLALIILLGTMQRFLQSTLAALDIYPVLLYKNYIFGRNEVYMRQQTQRRQLVRSPAVRIFGKQRGCDLVIGGLQMRGGATI